MGLGRTVLAVMMLSLGRLPAGADELSGLARAARERPDDLAAREAYARAALLAGREDEAIAALKDAIARIPGFLRGYYLLAVAHRARGEWLEAAHYFRVCLSLGQQENDALFGLGRALVQLGEKERGARALRTYVERERDPAKARFVDEARRELSRLAAAESTAVRDADDLLPPSDEPLAPAEAHDWNSPLDPFAGEIDEALSDQRATASGRARLLDLHDPFDDAAPPPLEHPPADRAAKARAAALRDCSAAIAAYRRSLVEEAERVQASYERGMSLTAAGRYRDAAVAFGSAAGDDGKVGRARRRAVQARAACKLGDSQKAAR